MSDLSIRVSLVHNERDGDGRKRITTSNGVIIKSHITHIRKTYIYELNKHGCIIFLKNGKEVIVTDSLLYLHANIEEQE